jgi:SNF2 family DNA or RNA helicase
MKFVSDLVCGVCADEKIVIVSHWTTVLDKLELLLAFLSVEFLRLDGATPSQVFASKERNGRILLIRSQLVPSGCFCYLAKPAE